MGLANYSAKFRGIVVFWFFAILPFAALANEEPPKVSEATLKISNRPIFTFRANFLGAPPNSRANRARLIIDEAFKDSSQLSVHIKQNPEGQLIMLGERLAFIVTSADLDPLSQDGLEAEAKAAAQRLEVAVEEIKESKNHERMLMAVGIALAATLALFILLKLLNRLQRRLSDFVLKLATRKAEALRIGNAQVIDPETMFPWLRRIVDFSGMAVSLFLVYEWSSFVLLRFPYTRSWGEQLNDYILNIAMWLLQGVISAIPGLTIAIAIFIVAKLFIGMTAQLLTRIAHSHVRYIWLAPETLPTTRRLLSVAVWLFAFAMAYPYLPGAQTEAFKGLSVLLGLMFSLGASSIIGQGTAGLVLTYTGSIRVGEYVRIGDKEGTVVDMGMFTTRIRTGLGEELTLPNSMITSSVTNNYSRAVSGPGFIVDAVVTIGYDTPWRQVEAMLLEAAKRTPSILTSPAPHVFQTALSDFYPEYRLVAQAIPSEPRPRAEVLSTLNANIQDVFNSYGVQIMSPHYVLDPKQAKIVKPEDWVMPPAVSPKQASDRPDD